ncbi:MAG: hypothetical protein H0Z39_08845 [Peptococcaceae bacterium]|nr:hypothetical protein [Peptococcaceae bacterium]
MIMRDHFFGTLGILLFIGSLLLYNHFHQIFVELNEATLDMLRIMRYDNLVALSIVTPGTLCLFLPRLVCVFQNLKAYRFRWSLFFISFILGVAVLMSVDLYRFTDMGYLFLPLFEYKISGAVIIGVGIIEAIYRVGS